MPPLEEIEIGLSVGERVLEKVAPVLSERLSTELPEIFGGVAKAAAGAGDKAALLSGADATALDRISSARWLKLESQSGGHALHITTSANGDPIFKIAYSSARCCRFQKSMSLISEDSVTTSCGRFAPRN